MAENQNQEKMIQDPAVVAKAGLWYTVCSFVFKAVAFLTTPLFARLMSKTELGGFTDFASLAAILMIVTSLDLYQSIVRSKSDHAEDMDSYIWSILSLSTLWTLLLYGVFLIFPEFCSNLLKIDQKYIHILFWYLLAAPPYTMLITRQRAFYKYKSFVLLTGIMTLSGTLLALLLVYLMEDNLTGRIIGFYSPYVLFGTIIFIYLAIRGKKIKPAYWKYAAVICLPLVPHALSLHILGVSDILLITRLCGKEFTAFYSIAFSAYQIASAFFDAMNKAWSPWLMDSLHAGNHEQIRKISRIYIAVFALIIVGLLMVVPEIVLILGGRQYARAAYGLPALLASSAFLFVMTMYVNVEVYEKKTVWVSLATVAGTAVNVILNLILLPLSPQNSYIIAAFTTLAGYMVLFTIHYFILRKMKMDHVYDIRFNVAVLGGILAVAGVMYLLYDLTIVRWILVALYAGGMLYLLYRFRGTLKKLFLKRK